MKIKIWILFIIILTGCIWSCNDDEFLKEIPETFYTTDNAFSTSSQVEQIITTLYSNVRSSLRCNDFNSMIRKGNGTDIFDVPSFRLANSFADYSKISPNHDFFYSDFSFWYSLISKANTALYASNLSNITWSSDEEKQYAIAQAKFFRAYAYRNLGELYGGVPLVDTIEMQARYDYKRSTRIETYQFAIDDLESIIDFLPETTNEGGKIVKGAAQHYLCELYLAMGIEMGEEGQNGSAMFAKAIENANKVIDGGIYSLMTDRFGKRASATGKNVYWDLFRDDNINYQDGNRESIWALQYDFNSYLAGDEESYLPYPRNYMPVLRSVPGMTGTAEDVGGRGVAYICPTMYVRELIWGSNFSNDLRNSECNIQRTFYYNNPAYPDLYGKVLPYSVLYVDNDFRSYEFPIFWKLSTDQFVGLAQGQNRSNLFRDDYVIRLPETILLRAEAYLRSGNSGQAANDINLIRRRAHCSYLVSADDVNIDFILDERARELFQEECRWNTLLRMGGTVAVDRIKKYTYWTSTTQSTLTFKYNLWPIPQSIIDRNKDIKLDQNPGWN